MSISPEKYYLGGLMKDIDKEDIPENMTIEMSNNETTYKSSQEINYNPCHKNFAINSPSTFFSPSLRGESFTNQSPSQNTINLESMFFLPKSNILSIFSDKNLTKELQRSLATSHNDVVNNFVNELKGSYRIIIKNKNGNYFCSDLIKKCNKEQRIQMLKELSNTINIDCTDEFGTHAIQNLIEYASGEEEYLLLLSSFDNFKSILMAAMNKNGTYVTQKLIVHIPEIFRMKFNSIFVNLIDILSRDMYGICTVKKFIGYTQNELIRKQFLNNVYKNFYNISSSQYGNYLIQYLLEKWWKSTEGVYLKKLIYSKFLVLAANYYSSFICDLFYKLCNDEEKKLLVSFINDNSNLKTIENIYQNNIYQNRIPLCLYKIIKTIKSEKEQNDKDKNNGEDKNIKKNSNNEE